MLQLKIDSADKYTPEEWALYREIRRYCHEEDLWAYIKENEDEYSDMTQAEFVEACRLYHKWRLEDDNWVDDAQEAIAVARMTISELKKIREGEQA